MFDLRYHVASLAAVFFALVIGILVGVALASHGLGNTERKRLEEDLRRAENQAEVLRSQVDSLSQTVLPTAPSSTRPTRASMANRLKGKRVAVLFVGSSSDDRRSAITQALADAGAGSPLRFTARQGPGRPERRSRSGSRRSRSSRTTPARSSSRTSVKRWDRSSSPGRTRRCGTHCGVRSSRRRVGPSKTPADGVVDRSHGEGADRSDRRLPQGSLRRPRGRRRSRRSAWSARRTTALRIKAFQRAGLSTVDDIDLQFGKLALIALLADPALSGDFGTRSAKAAAAADRTAAPTGGRWMSR